MIDNERQIRIRKNIDAKIPKHDVKVCTPYYNIIEEKCEQGIYNLLDSNTLNCAWMHHRGTVISETRNTLVNNMKSDREYQEMVDDFTHYLFVDADIVVTENAIKKLLSLDLDIVSAAYKSRPNRYVYVGGFFSREDGNVIDVTKTDTNTKGLLEVDWVGGGCLLVKKEVFEKTAYPWFQFPVLTKVIDGHTHKRTTGEDVGFCMNAKKHGYKVWMDFDTEVEHLARSTNDDFDVLHKNLNNDLNQMFQAMRMQSYTIANLQEKLENKEE